MKDKYAVNPSHQMNVFIACMEPSESGGRTGGYGMFPWDPLALTARGGIFINSFVMGPEYTTLTHEFGHNFGLFHSFYGQAEVPCGSTCYEPVHGVGDSAADRRGDFCSDTLAAPRYGDCGPPSGLSCENDAWIVENEIWENVMSYSPCRAIFTEQQRKRAHCFLCHELRSIVTGCPLNYS